MKKKKKTNDGVTKTKSAGNNIPPKTMKRLNQNLMDKMFDYATSAREETMDFAEGNTTGKYWLKMIYDEQANKFARKMIRQSGVKGTQTRLRRQYNKMYGKGCW